MNEWMLPNIYPWSSKHRIWNPAMESLSARAEHTRCALLSSHPHTQNGDCWLDTGHSDPLASRHGTCQSQFSRLRGALRWTLAQRLVLDSLKQLHHKWNPQPTPRGKPHLWRFLFNAHGQHLFRLPSLQNNQTASEANCYMNLVHLLPALKVYFIHSLPVCCKPKWVHHHSLITKTPHSLESLILYFLSINPLLQWLQPT